MGFAAAHCDSEVASSLSWQQTCFLLQTNRGELKVLLGPNGTGKSSLLKVLTQEHRASGEVRFFGNKAADWSIEKLAKQFSKQGATVIIVMHDLNLAAQYADRVMILNQGKIVADGTLWQVLTEQHIQQVYQWQVKIIAHPEAGYPLVIS